MLTVSKNERGKAFFINSSNSLSTIIYSKFFNISEYFSLRKENEKLIKENLKLRKSECSEKNNILKQTSSSPFVLDSVRKKQYTYYSGQVVKNSIVSVNNFITINKGTKDGIDKDMGVITNSGVVGIVVNVSKHYCVVLSVLNTLNGIGCKLKNTNYYGMAFWDGGSYRDLILDGIPNQIKLEKGDTVVTSGYSTFFPEGINVGTIDTFKKNVQDNFYTIHLRLSVDLKKLNNVYLIKNNLANEQLILQKQTEDIYK